MVSAFGRPKKPDPERQNCKKEKRYRMMDCVEGLYCKRSIQLSGVFRNIDPPPPHRPASAYGGRTHSLGGEGGWRVNSSEDARHCSVLYICTVSTVLCDGLLLLPCCIRPGGRRAAPAGGVSRATGGGGRGAPSAHPAPPCCPAAQ
jgi:hypothetical protein